VDGDAACPRVDAPYKRPAVTSRKESYLGSVSSRNLHLRLVRGDSRWSRPYHSPIFESLFPGFG
jgi:hypothetical protein